VTAVRRHSIDGKWR